MELCSVEYNTTSTGSSECGPLLSEFPIRSFSSSAQVNNPATVSVAHSSEPLRAWLEILLHFLKTIRSTVPASTTIASEYFHTSATNRDFEIYRIQISTISSEDLPTPATFTRPQKALDEAQPTRCRTLSPTAAFTSSEPRPFACQALDVADRRLKAIPRNR